MKRIAIWLLVIGLLLAAVACGDKEQKPAPTPAAGPTDNNEPGGQNKPAVQTQEQEPQPEVFSIIAYAVGGVRYEGEQLTQYGIVPTVLTLNADHTGVLNLMGTEMDVGWTDDGGITVGGQPFCTYTRVDGNTVVMKLMDTEFTLERTGGQQPGTQTVEQQPAQTQQPGTQTEQQPAETQQPGTQTEQLPTPAPAQESAAVEPYGDSDGVIDHNKLAALYHWLDSMQSDFRYLLTFDEIGAAAGKPGCDRKDGDGKYHGAFWTDGNKGFVTITFREKDGKWTCGSITCSGIPREEYNAADISGFPKLGSSAPAGSSPVESVTLDQSCSGKAIHVTASVPTKNWYPKKGSFDLRYNCAPDETAAKNSSSYILVEFFASEDRITDDIAKYENVQDLGTRTIGGVGMKGLRYERYGMEWTEYYGQVTDGVWASIKLTGVDLSAGTETDAIVNSLTFAVD